MSSGCKSNATTALYVAMVGTIRTIYHYVSKDSRNTINMVSRHAITRCGSSVKASTCRLMICSDDDNSVVTDICSGGARIFRGCALGTSKQSNTTIVVTVFPILVGSRRFDSTFRSCQSRGGDKCPSVAGTAGTVTLVYSGTCQQVGSSAYATTIGIGVSGTNGVVQISRTRLSSNTFAPAAIITKRFAVFTGANQMAIGGTSTVVRRGSFIKGCTLRPEALDDCRRSLVPTLPR